MNIQALEQYFPTINKPIQEQEYTFTITIQQEQEVFAINLKIKQQDTKQERLIKFRLGIGQDAPKKQSIHQTNKPHFEIDLYMREESAFSATIYFTFQEATNTQLLEYAKGTVVVINKILENFVTQRDLSRDVLSKLVYTQAITEELAEYEQKLVEALYACYKEQDLIIRRPGEEPLIIKTPHNLEKYLGHTDLFPIYTALIKKINQH